MSLDPQVISDQEKVKNAKEYYDYYVNVDINLANHYKRLIEFDTSATNNKTSELLIKDISLKHVRKPIKIIPLRQRVPKNGYAKTIAEIIEEALIEQDRPLTAKELFEAIRQKRRKVGKLKDFSSQIISISKAKNYFFKQKIRNINYWGLSEWNNGIGFKEAYRKKII